MLTEGRQPEPPVLGLQIQKHGERVAFRLCLFSDCVEEEWQQHWQEKRQELPRHLTGAR